MQAWALFLATKPPAKPKDGGSAAPEVSGLSTSVETLSEQGLTHHLLCEGRMPVRIITYALC